MIGTAIIYKQNNTITWNLTLLDKIIYNLLSNAAKYGKEGGTVSISAITNDKYDEVEIKVSDDGDGISAKQMKHLFKRFHDGDYRQHQTNGTQVRWNLSMSKRAPVGPYNSPWWQKRALSR